MALPRGRRRPILAPRGRLVHATPNDDGACPTREAARQDVFEYIEMFYNPKRKHTNNGMLSPANFEAQQQKLNEAAV